MDSNEIKKIVAKALAEDIGSGDLTANLIPANKVAHAKIISQQAFVICGSAFAAQTFAELDPNIKITWHVKDGDAVTKNQLLGELKGSARHILTGERTALNFLQTLSSTATLTQRFVEKIAGTNAKLLDTRKTLPGLRLAQKYAVICGGGINHRLGLYAGVLIKENHIRASGSITAAITQARALYPKKTIEVEVRNIAELEEALTTSVDIIMLDNFSLASINQAVKINSGKAKLEVSGQVNLENIHDFAATGVDYISVGMITKTVIPIEITMLFE